MRSRFDVLLSGSAGGGVDVWDVDTGANLLTHTNPKLNPTSTATCHSHTSTGRHQLHLPDPVKPYVHFCTFSLSHTSSSSIASSSSSSLPSTFSALALSPSSLFLAAASSSSPTVFLFSHSTGALLASYAVHYKAVRCLAFSPDERFVLSGGDDGCINATALTDALHDPDAQRPLLPHVPPSLLPSHGVMGGGGGVKAHCSFASHSLPVTGLCVAPGSAHPLVFSASLDHSVHVHSLVGQDTVQRFVFPCALTALQVTSTLSALFVGGQDGHVYCQPLIHSAVRPGQSTAGVGGKGAGGTSTAPVQMPGHTLPVTCLSLSYDCALLVSASRDGSLRLWDTRSLQCIRVIRKVGRASFDWCLITRDAGEGREWPPLRGTRRREDETTVPLTVRRVEAGGDGVEDMEERMADWMEDWRVLVGEDERSRAVKALDEERQKRLQAEAEVQRWTRLSNHMYRMCAQLRLKQRRMENDNSAETKETADEEGQTAVEGDALDETVGAVTGEDVDEGGELAGEEEKADEAMEEERAGSEADVT